MIYPKDMPNRTEYQIQNNPRFARRRAKLLGETRYFTGNPCPKGHIAHRMTTSGRCVECNAIDKITHREKILAQSKEYMSRPEVRAKRRIYERERKRGRPDVVITSRMRAMLRACLVGKVKGVRGRLGYTTDELKTHLERQFLKGMTWENIGEWEIDHIVPISHFKFTSADDPDFWLCWALSNLRPLWKSDNRKKSNIRTHLI